MPVICWALGAALRLIGLVLAWTGSVKRVKRQTGETQYGRQR